MKILIIYDSVFGNTEKIARAIGGAVAGEVRVVQVSQADVTQLSPLEMLVIGAPTYGGRPREPMQDFLKGIPEGALKNVKVAAFDTRLAGRFVKVFGFAAEKISENLTGKGGTLASPPEGFFVKGREGPLKEGELERAAAWAKNLVK